ncbi:2,4-dienoyl-CoA reductase-like NADH-dependent reductase (Old Yellow Enzyme family) [Dongia mobilis]|uniref:2,4-dienoyl-CoA reductase-like NADH-dependent reductase (Old Yellow Enzyme family) n=1 Tax=Dongia mobilis TaxID=578943 RepID=A0A4R6WG10_9PROT|nr:FAD-dependent oxidoreductase [Dongia mobilis]TDQ78960.1 2,4-dienoyl-CoA reductase-like NADH-dependent reductase (Old Yellow Enzyme family) [Dongia mobilis]
MADPLLQPYHLKHLNLKNRIFSTSHEPAYSEGGMPGLRYQLYHEEKAKGGAAMTMIGGSSVIAKDSPQAFGNLYVHDNAIIPHFRELAKRVHAYDCAVMCQITHLGRRTSWHKEHWLPIISASHEREPAHRGFPKMMEDHDIARVVKAYGEATARCREGDLDGVEIEAYGHLFDSFLSPRTNSRTDEYGGSLENRMRFGIAVLTEMRHAAGPDFIIGLRMAVDEAAEDGFGFQEGVEIARRLRDAKLIDFLNVIVGTIDSDESLSHIIPLMGTPAGPNFAKVKAARAALPGLPIFHAARVNDLATARHWVADDAVDLIGMTRAHMADPHIVAKLMRGEEERIRPCVGAGYCIDRIYQGGEALCLHNPATGREATMPHVIRPGDGPRRKVVIVGAGPAGLEAARVSALRGHDVVLFEATDRPGGQVAIAAKVNRRKELIGITDWLFAEATRAGVTFRFNTYAEGADILAERPDIVVIATGGTPNTAPFREGGELATSTWDVLSGQVALSGDVLLYDDESGHEALSTAEFLTDKGIRFELVTPERAIGVEVGGLNYPAYYKAFYQGGVTLTPNLRMTAIRRDGNQLVASLFNAYDKSRHQRRAQQIIVAHGNLAADAVYFDLKDQSRNRGEIDIDAFIEGRPQVLRTNPAGTFQLFRIGDAVATRNIHAAIYDGLRLCKAF